MAKLTDTQLVILSAAAKREDGNLLPLPRSLKVDKASATGALKSIFKSGLAAERVTAEAAQAWREEKDGSHLALIITPAGLEAIGVAPETGGPSRAAKPNAAKKKRHSSEKGRPTDPAAASTAGKVRPGTKLAALVELLGRKQGGTLGEAIEATGWQAHSVRGAISGTLKKRLGLTVTSEVVTGRGRTYRIAPGA